MRYFPYRLNLCTLLILVISLMACQASNSHYSERSQGPLNPALQGVWRSNGYGYVIQVNESGIRSYHATSKICIEDTDIGHIFYAYAQQSVEGGKLRLSNDGQRLYLSEPFESYAIEFHRQSRLPEVCHEPLENTPQQNFLAFSQYMATHYAYFDLYEVNWSERVKQYQHRVSDDLSEAQLFDLFSDMLAPLEDAHLSLQGEVEGKTLKYHPEISPVGKATSKIAQQQGTTKKKIDHYFMEYYWLHDIRDGILQSDGVMTANDWIQYGITKNGLGYIAIAATYNYADQGLYHDAEDRFILNQTLDKALNLFNERDVTAVIIDLSINIGGHSFPAIDIASRFAEHPTLAYSKRAYDAKDQAAFAIQVPVSKDAHFYGPVYLLASCVTVSGGEEVVLALNALPNVTFIGENTRGAFSDILDKPLPNGWNLALSNEIYTDHNGISWEGNGIQPDIAITVFDRDNPFTGHKQAVEWVMQHIEQDSKVQ